MRSALFLLILAAIGVARAQDATPPQQSEPPQPGTRTPATAPGESALEPLPASLDPAEPTGPPPPAAPAGSANGSAGPEDTLRWLDRTHQVLYNSMWHSAQRVDRWFGSTDDQTVYKQVYGSIAPAVLYSGYDQFRELLRFNMNFPLPRINDQLHAFVGRVDPNEFITERDESTGAIPRTYGPQTEDQTLFGIGYHQPPRQGGRFDFGTGIRIALPMDPYIKGSYIFERGTSESGLFSVRETLFWQHSEGAGETTRLDLERILGLQWLVRYTLSGTRSQESQGLRGYSSILVLHGLPSRRALAFEIGIDGETEAPVQLHDYGMKVAYRQGVLRRWLIMEVRASLDWPRDFIYQRRAASVGVGIAFEMLIGTEEFRARPVTF